MVVLWVMHKVAYLCLNVLLGGRFLLVWVRLRLRFGGFALVVCACFVCVGLILVVAEVWVGVGFTWVVPLGGFVLWRPV